jgi:hypothetical protein
VLSLEALDHIHFHYPPARWARNEIPVHENFAVMLIDAAVFAALVHPAGTVILSADNGVFANFGMLTGFAVEYLSHGYRLPSY